MYDDYLDYDDRDFHYSTPDEWDKAEAWELGQERPDSEYILTDRDVLHKNPFFRGVSSEPVISPVSFEEDIPF